VHGLRGGQWVRAPRAPPPDEHEGVSCSLQLPLRACARPTRLSGLCVSKKQVSKHAPHPVGTRIRSDSVL
jgi:hypothetical protein